MKPPAHIWELVRAQAIDSLSSRQREQTNLSLDFRVWRKGEFVGPKFQKIVLADDSILVWADDEPLANFGHACRYLLYDPNKGKFRGSIEARFPPYTNRQPDTLQYIHRPIRPQSYEALTLPPWLKAAATLAKKDFSPPPLIPPARRFAILFSGITEPRDLNTLEFCYRMLKHYDFAEADIHVVSYDGTFNTTRGAPDTWGGTGKWPGDETDYQLKSKVMTGKGTPLGWQTALNAIRPQMSADSLLFVFTAGHGDRIATGESFLTTFPNEDPFNASVFCSDLSTIIKGPFGSKPQFGALVVLMQQCLAGGFNGPLLAASNARETSVASASDANTPSHGTLDFNWDIFARNWIAAQLGREVDLNTVVNADSGPTADGAIQSEEAYRYCDDKNTAETDARLKDIPTSAYSTNGRLITLSLPHPLTVPMAPTFVTVISKYVSPKTPPWRFYETLKRIQPRLQELILPILNSTQKSLEREITAAIEPTIAAAFKPRKRKPPKRAK